MAHVPTYHSASASKLVRHVDSELLSESRNTAAVVVSGYRARNFCQKDRMKSKKCAAVSLVDVPLGVSAHVFLRCRPSMAFPTKQIADKRLLKRVLGLTFTAGAIKPHDCGRACGAFTRPIWSARSTATAKIVYLRTSSKQRVSRMANVDVCGENVLAPSFSVRVVILRGRSRTLIVLKR
jgi:hypothetical protein